MALVRGLVGYAPAVIVPRLVTLLQVTLLTRLIAPQEFGLVVLVITLGDAIDSICINWLRVVLGRYGSGQAAAALAEEAARALLLFCGVTLLVSLPAVALTSAYQKTGGAGLFLCLASYVVVNGAARLSLTIMAIRSLKLPFFVVEAIRTLVGFAGVMALAWTGIATHAVPLLTAMNAATALAAVIGLVVALRGVGLKRPHGWGFDRASYAGPLIVGTVVGVLLGSSDRLIVEGFAGPAALAVYAASVMLARQPLEFLFSVVHVRVFPELMATYERSGPKVAGERMGDLVSIMAMLSLPATIGLALVADPLARTFLPEAYMSAARIVIPLGAVAGLMIGFKNFVFDLPLHMRKAILSNTLMVLPATLLGIATAALLAARIGAIGCVIGLVVQCGLALAVSIVQACRLVPIVLNRRDLGHIALMCAAMTVAVSGGLAALADAAAPLRLACAVAIGGGTYAVAALVLKPGPVRDLLPARRAETA